MAKGNKFMKRTTATIADIEAAIVVCKAAFTIDPTLEGSSGKKLFAAEELILPKDGVTKVLNQAYGLAEKKWALNVVTEEKDGCTMGNKLEKIKQYVQKSDGYDRFSNNKSTTEKVQTWLDKKFPIQPDPSEVDEAA